MRHPQRLLLTIAALITVSSCKSEAPKPPPPKVQAVSTQLAEFTEGVDEEFDREFDLFLHISKRYVKFDF